MLSDIRTDGERPDDGRQMKMPATPVLLITLLSIHVFPDAHLSSQFHAGCVEYLVQQDLIRLVRSDPNRIYLPTERGLAYIRMLTETPLPVAKYVDPRVCAN